MTTKYKLRKRKNKDGLIATSNTNSSLTTFHHDTSKGVILVNNFTRYF